MRPPGIKWTDCRRSSRLTGLTVSGSWRVKRTWWSSRSSKPLPDLRLCRGVRFDSYPLSHLSVGCPRGSGTRAWFRNSTVPCERPLQLLIEPLYRKAVDLLLAGEAHLPREQERFKAPVPVIFSLMKSGVLCRDHRRHFSPPSRPEALMGRIRQCCFSKLRRRFVVSSAGEAYDAQVRAPNWNPFEVVISRMANVKTKRGVIGILTGGGDVPGLNPAIRAVTFRALREGYEVIGIRRGWAGLIDIVRDKKYDNSDNFQWLTEDVVNRAGRSGGTFLHSSRTNPVRVRSSEVPPHLKDKYTAEKNDLTPEVLKNLR